MSLNYLGIEKIVQKDNYNFLIKWSDGQYQELNLAQLQRKCTCARCYDRDKRIALLSPSDIKDVVKAIRIYSIGRYALKIDFDSGCSQGIYTYQFLRHSYEDI